MFFFILILKISINCAQAQTNILITAPDHVNVGETFVTSFSIDQISDCSGFDLIITYQPKYIICATENKDGGFISDFQVADNIDCQNGTIQYANANLTPKNGNGTLFTTTWKALTDGIVNIRLKSALLSNSDAQPIEYIPPQEIKIVVGNPLNNNKFDMNEDGNINILDLIVLLQKITDF